jgi:hypothetical protein
MSTTVQGFNDCADFNGGRAPLIGGKSFVVGWWTESVVTGVRIWRRDWGERFRKAGGSYSG